MSMSRSRSLGLWSLRAYTRVGIGASSCALPCSESDPGYLCILTYASATAHSASSCSELSCSTFYGGTTSLRFSRLSCGRFKAFKLILGPSLRIVAGERGYSPAYRLRWILHSSTTSSNVFASRTAYSPSSRCPSTRGTLANPLDGLYAAALAGPGGGESK